MNKKELVKNLVKDIQDIYSIANRFENTEQIHPIDIDLALSKVRNLYELLLKLNPQEYYTTEYQKEEILTIPKHATEKETVINEEETIKIKNTKTEKIQKPELIIEDPSKKEEVFEQKTISNKEKNKEVLEIKKEENLHEIIADKFHSKKFVHDNIAKKNFKKDVSSKLKSKPIDDISSAIGLNDKFILIRELFGGNKDLYQETIQVLNNFDTFENALDFLKENFAWDSEDPNFERLKELVRRKYS